MQKNITALFETHTAADRAMDALLRAGFDQDQISMVLSEDTRTRYYGDDRAEEGAAWGAGVGAIAGGLVALAAAPPIGIVAAGPLLAVLGGAVAGGAGGSVFGALVGMGIPEETARVYEERLRAGAILVAVTARTDTEATQAHGILENTTTTRPNERIVISEMARP